MSKWSEYVRELTGNEPQDEVGARIGVSGSTISRWRSGKNPGNPAEVALLAQKYNREVLEAFVAAGYLTYEQAGMRDVLAREISDTRRRMEELQDELAAATIRLGELLEESNATQGRYALAADSGDAEPMDDEPGDGA